VRSSAPDDRPVLVVEFLADDYANENSDEEGDDHDCRAHCPGAETAAAVAETSHLESRRETPSTARRRSFRRNV
jgi:hypothetical protein